MSFTDEREETWQSYFKNMFQRGIAAHVRQEQQLQEFTEKETGARDGDGERCVVERAYPIV